MTYIAISDGVALWAFIGTLYLLIMTYQDLFKKMLVDDRFNFFMMGSSMMLLAFRVLPWYYLFALLAVISGLNWYMKKFKVLGDADISAIRWVYYGYGIIGYQPFMLFVGVFLLFGLLYFILRIAVFKIPDNKPTPFFPVLLFSFILTNILWGLYAL